MLTKRRTIKRQPHIKESISAPSFMDRLTFLKQSGLAAIAAALTTGVPLSRVHEAKANTEGNLNDEIKKVLSVCTHCSVGCTVTAEVQNGVWVGQEPSFDSPFNLGAHCAKGASVREHAHGERRLKYPTKMENGQWKRISWEQALSLIHI